MTDKERRLVFHLANIVSRMLATEHDFLKVQLKFARDPKELEIIQKRVDILQAEIKNLTEVMGG